eukprot:GHUV01023916.1.p1 GENE.GHUV01023916.1~~GHUV01023916.1.p1  ORF type:complete len:179 (+),score=26.23 GHUV01023916.1:93-629(+)
MALAQRLGRSCALHPVQCRVIAGLRRCSGRVSSVPAAHTTSAQKRTSTRVNVALAEPQDVQASFATLLDDEDEYEYEFEEGEDVVEEAEVDTTLLVENQGLSQEVIYALKKRGINALFPIQLMVLQPALEGVDLIGRAKTGSGKTLAFALPVVESLLAEDLQGGFQAGGRKARGRTPR